MRTTIVVQDDGAAAVSVAAGAAVAPKDQSPGSGPVDAGAAPGGAVGPTVGAARSQGGADAGMPPSWLVEAIAQAGGMTAPDSPEDIALTGLDGGGAPS